MHYIRVLGRFNSHSGDIRRPGQPPKSCRVGKNAFPSGALTHADILPRHNIPQRMFEMGVEERQYMFGMSNVCVNNQPFIAAKR